MLKTFHQISSRENLNISKTASRLHSQETHKMNNEKMVQKYTNRNESFDKHAHKFEAKSTLNSTSKTTNSPGESIKKFWEKSSSQEKVGDDRESKDFQKPSIKSLTNMYSMRNNLQVGNHCVKPETNDKFQSKTKTNSNNKISDINLKETIPDDYSRQYLY